VYYKCANDIEGKCGKECADINNEHKQAAIWEENCFQKIVITQNTEKIHLYWKHWSAKDQTTFQFEQEIVQQNALKIELKFVFKLQRIVLVNLNVWKASKTEAFWKIPDTLFPNSNTIFDDKRSKE